VTTVQTQVDAERRVGCAVAVVAATDVELRFVRNGLLRVPPGGHDDNQIAVLRCGIGVRRPQCVENAAPRQAIVSAGFAAGLDPRLRPGDIVLPRFVIDSSGGTHGACPVLHRRLASVLETLGQVYTEAVADTKAVLFDSRDKRRLFRQSGAASADMESARLAETGRKSKLRFVVLRVILDPADAALPPSIAPAGWTGQPPGPGRIMRELFAHPGEIRSFLSLLRSVNVAGRSLSAAMQCAAPVLQSSGAPQ